VIDDTWTTGASAQSAAAALTAAGCGTVAAVVIGRHINRDWGPNDQELAALPPFAWDRCALCGRSGQWAGNASTHPLVSKATAP
jgi:adenine/guanine phosphoribosyltransferase-like PRPP-binding protein